MLIRRLLIVIVALATAVAGFLLARNLERSRAAKESAALTATYQAELVATKGAGRNWAEAIATRQGEAILRAFVAGITPSLLAERRESLEISAVSLLRVPGVDGIHVFRPDGSVYYSSDAKLVTVGSAGEEGAWSLAATDFISRSGAREGTLDLAVPVVDSGRTLATVWLQYALAGVRDAERPAGW